MAVEVRDGVLRLVCPECGEVLCIEESGVVSCGCGWHRPAVRELEELRSRELEASRALHMSAARLERALFGAAGASMDLGC